MPEFAAPPPGLPSGAVSSAGAPGALPTGAALPAPIENTGNEGNNEGNVAPGGLDPAGTGGASGGASTGATSEDGTAAGGSASSAGGAAMASGGSTMSSGGATSPDDGMSAAGTSAAGTSTGGTGEASPPDQPVQPEASCPPNALFCDDFEDDIAGQFPSAPWQNNTGSGATVRVDGVQAFSGRQAVHVNAPPNAGYRRGYFSLEQGSSSVFPALSRGMFGRAMMWLDATPNAVVHWTIIQGEGRAADGTHDAYYRYGGQQQGGAGIMANYETNGGVSTDCYSHSATRMPVQRWACVEWHFDVARNEMQLWLDGEELDDMHVVDRPTTPGSGCLGNATNGQWLAPPAFTTLHLGWENYQTSSNDRNLWIDDVAVGAQRMGCPAP